MSETENQKEKQRRAIEGKIVRTEKSVHLFIEWTDNVREGKVGYEQ